MIITAGKFKGKKIIAPDENITRPTLSKVRMSVFNTLQAIIDFEDLSFLDMYAGSGVMGLEAISRGFGKVTAIEKNPKAYKILKNNYQTCRCEQMSDLTISLNIGDSLKITPKLTDKFDVIYIDPPYFSGIYEKSLEAVKNISSGIIILEHVTDVDFSGFEQIKQKKYGDKFISFCKVL